MKKAQIYPPKGLWNKEKSKTHAKQKSLWIGWRAGFKLYWSLETIKIARVLVEGKEGFIPVV